MTDSKKLEDILRSYKLDVGDLDFTIGKITSVFKASEKFNTFNFVIGVLSGMAAMWIIFKLYHSI